MASYKRVPVLNVQSSKADEIAALHKVREACGKQTYLASFLSDTVIRDLEYAISNDLNCDLVGQLDETLRSERGAHHRQNVERLNQLKAQDDILGKLQADLAEAEATRDEWREQYKAQQTIWAGQCVDRAEERIAANRRDSAWRTIAMELFQKVESLMDEREAMEREHEAKMLKLKAAIADKLLGL